MMDRIWLIGLAGPVLMLSASAWALATRHRWRGPICAGAAVGVAFSMTAWSILRLVLRDADRPFEIGFLQIAFSTVGLFGFGVSAMIATRLLNRSP